MPFPPPHLGHWTLIRDAGRWVVVPLCLSSSQEMRGTEPGSLEFQGR